MRKFIPFPVIDVEKTGENILRLRLESGLSVEELRRFFGFGSPQAIYHWQKGICLPSVDHLLALSKVLDVPMEDILILKSPPQPQVQPTESGIIEVDVQNKWGCILRKLLRAA